MKVKRSQLLDHEVMRFKFFSCQSHCPLGKTYVLVILQTSDTVSQKSQQVLYTVDLVRPKKIIPKTNLNGSKNCFNFQKPQRADN